jgi:two-component system CheB/CheR fusion protein
MVTSSPSSPGDSTQETASRTAFPIVGIGASAGGIEAFSNLLRNLPDNTGMAFVYVQHLMRQQESMLSSILSRVCAMPVSDVTDDVLVKPNHVYVITPDKYITVAGGHLRLLPRTDLEGEVSLPIDCFFQSLAQEQQGRAIGIVLSGTGSDGALGIMAIKEAHGITLAQDDKTAKFGQMPYNAVSTGCVDFVLNPAAIAETLINISRHPLINSSDEKIREIVPENEDSFHQILLLLKKASGIDFFSYKPATIKRRIVRRMVLGRKKSLKVYLGILREQPKELEALTQDLLIKVTRFFRDEHIFEALKKDVFPQISADKDADAPLRIWVPGCSTGEEVYSLAIALLEFLGDRANQIPIQLFGSDLNNTCIEAARTGMYPDNIAADVSPERLKRFFIKTIRGYRIAKSIRDRCIFAKLNVTTDPPFSRMDLISCRNLLIYLSPSLQKRVIPVFHYALYPHGFLLLGQSETVVSFPELFQTVNQKAKIYAKKQAQTRLAFGHFSTYSADRLTVSRPPEPQDGARTRSNVLREVDRVILAKYDQAGIVINEEMEILQYRGDTSRFMKSPPGVPSFNLLKMVREGLLTELRKAVNTAMKADAPYKKDRIRMKSDGAFKNVSLEVFPLKPPGVNEKHLLILFGEGQEESKKPGLKNAKTSLGRPLLQEAPGHAAEMTSLKEELASTNAYMQSVIEEREAANEELQAANEENLSSNEELQSMNEELQSANEELQTAKEELQASNEEITTVNDELNIRNTQLTQLNDYLSNLLNSIELPVVMVGLDLRIRRFTPAAEKVFRLIPTDTGRPIGDIKPRIEIRDLEALIGTVIKDLTITEHEVQDEQGHWLRMQIRPYRTGENKIDGAVIAVLDIDVLKQNELLLKSYADFQNAIIQAVHVPLLVLEKDLRVRMANRGFYRMFNVPSTDIENTPIYQLGDGQWNVPQLRKLLEKLVSLKKEVVNYEVESDFPSLGHRVMVLNAQVLGPGKDADGEAVLLSIEDITQRKEAERKLQNYSHKLERSNVELQQFATTASHDLQQPIQLVSNFLGILESQYRDRLDEKAREFIVLAREGSARAQVLIKKLLEYARLDGHLSLENVSMEAVVKEALSDLRDPVKESGAEVVWDPLPKIKADKVFLVQLLGNLISNSIKYRSDKPVRIYISAQKKRKEIVFSVEDNGLGMDPRHKDRIFNMFERLGRKQQGTGIGLATCKKIMERHGGKIWVESTPGKGSVFYLSFPQK